MLARKLVLTTVVAAVVWLGIYIVVHEPWLSFRDS
jgi:predicted secreted protein